ncbi:MAG TPA: hypothetical protein VEX38_06350, partial [Fimbriimonadaceae bacterium]|nr:hypothetical protein [Fimbriimonadaceae bacterium]
MDENRNLNDDNIQHGLDDNPSGDAEKGAALGGLGGAATGAMAGAALGPAGAVIGAVVGGVVGAAASGVAVAAVDRVDNDNNVTGIGDSTATDWNSGANSSTTDMTYTAPDVATVPAADLENRS